ncbi:MAG: T9SS type A sorting domain-containing protein [Ignavibacteria bacterium]|nr:T9SS type A sorting domain-containing protein [Ignavibacteria bacterium]
MKMLTRFFVIYLFAGTVFSQSSFYDGFETGDFSKWDNNVGATISTAFKHSGNYSAKFETVENVTHQITKNNSSTGYLKIDFYAYVTDWFENYAELRIGGNGLLWFFGVKKQNTGGMLNCQHQFVSDYTVYFPMNYWNHVVIERIPTGYLYVWINGTQFVDGAVVGACTFTDIAFQTAAWHPPGNYSKIICYLDDITICYNSSNCTIGIQQTSAEIPNSFSLSQNYPNPFNPTTNIKFDIPKSSNVKLVIYDALGREVAVLANEELKAGTYQADWDASEYSSGVYYYKIEAGEFIETKKMIVLK